MRIRSTRGEWYAMRYSRRGEPTRGTRPTLRSSTPLEIGRRRNSADAARLRCCVRPLSRGRCLFHSNVARSYCHPHLSADAPNGAEQMCFHGAFLHAGRRSDLQQIHIFDEAQQEHRALRFRARSAPPAIPSFTCSRRSICDSGVCPAPASRICVSISSELRWVRFQN